MAALKDLIVSGPGRILGPLYSDSFIKTNGTSSQILLADGNTLAKSDIVSYSQTVASTTTGAYVIGKITINGTQTTIYGKDTTGGGGGGVTLLENLDDVDLDSSLTSKQILIYGEGGKWINADQTDEKVQQLVINTNTNKWRKILVSTNYHDTSTGSITNSTISGAYYSNGIAIQPSTNYIAASGFVKTNATNTNSILLGGGGEIAMTSSNANKVLASNNSGSGYEWILPVHIYYGNTGPDDSFGNDGDIFILTHNQSV